MSETLRDEQPGPGRAGGMLRVKEAIPMKEKPGLSTKPSEPAKVDAYVQELKHPLVEVVRALRRVILTTDPTIGEEIKWNAPTFFYTGEMKPFNPKEYRRYMIVFNLYRKDCIRLVFPSGARINDTSGFLEGDYADGRRLALFHTTEEVELKTKALRRVIKRWLTSLDKT
jgi:hypothetical protein